MNSMHLQAVRRDMFKVCSHTVLTLGQAFLLMPNSKLSSKQLSVREASVVRHQSKTPVSPTGGFGTDLQHRPSIGVRSSFIQSNA